MKQNGCAAFKSEDGKIQLICDNDTALGKLHDFLMMAKGEIVDRMVKAQKEENAVSEEQKDKDKEENPDEIEDSPQE